MDDIRDYAIEQNWSEYSADEHAIWRLLFDRQQRLLIGRACRDYLDGLEGLGVAAAGVTIFRPRPAAWRCPASPLPTTSSAWRSRPPAPSAAGRPISSSPPYMAFHL